VVVVVAGPDVVVVEPPPASAITGATGDALGPPLTMPVGSELSG
jgi:hypothetical protein